MHAISFGLGRVYKGGNVIVLRTACMWAPPKNTWRAHRYFPKVQYGASNVPAPWIMMLGYVVVLEAQVFRVCGFVSRRPKFVYAYELFGVLPRFEPLNFRTRAYVHFSAAHVGLEEYWH